MVSIINVLWIFVLAIIPLLYSGGEEDSIAEAESTFGVQHLDQSDLNHKSTLEVGISPEEMEYKALIRSPRIIIPRTTDKFCLFSCFTIHKKLYYVRIQQKLESEISEISRMNILNDVLLKMIYFALLDKSYTYLSRQSIDLCKRFEEEIILTVEDFKNRLWRIKPDLKTKLYFRDSVILVKGYKHIWEAIIYFSWGMPPSSMIWLNFMDLEDKISSIVNSILFLFGHEASQIYHKKLIDCVSLAEKCILGFHSVFYDLHRDIKILSSMKIEDSEKDLLFLLSIIHNQLFHKLHSYIMNGIIMSIMNIEPTRTLIGDEGICSNDMVINLELLGYSQASLASLRKCEDIFKSTGFQIGGT